MTFPLLDKSVKLATHVAPRMASIYGSHTGCIFSGGLPCSATCSDKASDCPRYLIWRSPSCLPFSCCLCSRKMGHHLNGITVRIFKILLSNDTKCNCPHCAKQTKFQITFNTFLTKMTESYTMIEKIEVSNMDA